MSLVFIARVAMTIAIGTLYASTSFASDCPGNALGTSRILTVNPSEFPLVGKLEYRETLRLNDREVVLTFSEGPSAPYTSNILDILASECLRATFFMSGRGMVDTPDIARRALDEGHTIGTQTYDNSELGELPIEQAKADIDKGIATAVTVLGDQKAAPFFRAPSEISKQAERYVLSKGLMVWSADVDVEDWNEPTENEFVRRAISGLETQGKGILLMRDAQPVTARALRQLIEQLKARKFKVVHVVPAKSPSKTVSNGASAFRSDPMYISPLP
jgi:peptidoglycan/xylan/chitin deacetylase (PgdA/CDA1 family)